MFLHTKDFGDISETRNIIRKPSDDEPLSGLAFKIMNDPFVGSLTLLEFILAFSKR